MLVCDRAKTNLSAVNVLGIPVIYDKMGLISYSTKRFMQGMVIEVAGRSFRVSGPSQVEHEILGNSIKDSMSAFDIDPLLLSLMYIVSGRGASGGEKR